MSKPLDLTKPVQTREGNKVQILCTDAPGAYPVVGIVPDNFNGPGGIEVDTWTLDGVFSRSDHPHELDLVNVPQEFSGSVFLNIYSNGSHASHGSRADADDFASPSRIACIEVPYSVTEGQGL